MEVEVQRHMETRGGGAELHRDGEWLGEGTETGADVPD